ncbi:MAG: (Fe-S)-binding protein, partial [Deltaproteobacteria bacterium]|nr:(Fe-S)-binding protein [Deltaproteobacteria bacterium]
IESAKGFALKNLEAFEGLNLDYITTACATCTNSLKNIFVRLLGSCNAELKERVIKFSSKVIDMTELSASLTKGEGCAQRGIKVTYHDPCHLARGHGVKNEPRGLLKKAGYELVEMDDPGRCCGMGGGLTFANHELSVEIAMKKAEDIVSTGAQIVATACPGCIIQIRDALTRMGANLPVAHVACLI